MRKTQHQLTPEDKRKRNSKTQRDFIKDTLRKTIRELNSQFKEFDMRINTDVHGLVPEP